MPAQRDLPGAVSAHEAAHAVIARVLDLEVVRAAAGKDAGVLTRSRLSRMATAAEVMATLERLALVDLSGPVAERRHLGDACSADELRDAASADEANALSRARGIVLERKVKSVDALRIEAAELVEKLRARAASLVEENWPAIERVASALSGGEPLTGVAIDALIGAKPDGSLTRTLSSSVEDKTAAAHAGAA